MRAKQIHAKTFQTKYITIHMGANAHNYPELLKGIRNIILDHRIASQVYCIVSLSVSFHILLCSGARIISQELSPPFNRKIMVWHARTLNVPILTGWNNHWPLIDWLIDKLIFLSSVRIIGMKEQQRNSHETCVKNGLQMQIFMS